jgi:hypothetical protein
MWRSRRFGIVTQISRRLEPRSLPNKNDRVAGIGLQNLSGNRVARWRPHKEQNVPRRVSGESTIVFDVSPHHGTKRACVLQSNVVVVAVGVAAVVVVQCGDDDGHIQSVITVDVCPFVPQGGFQYPSPIGVDFFGLRVVSSAVVVVVSALVSAWVVFL